MGARRGRYLDGMVSIRSFMLPAVEIAWIDAFRAAALLPEIPAVAMPIAAGEAPRMGREEEEGVISRGVRRKWEKKKKIFLKFRVSWMTQLMSAGQKNREERWFLEFEKAYTMSAVVGGSVACFVLRVMETHQYLYFSKEGKH